MSKHKYFTHEIVSLIPCFLQCTSHLYYIAGKQLFFVENSAFSAQFCMITVESDLDDAIVDWFLLFFI